MDQFDMFGLFCILLVLNLVSSIAEYRSSKKTTKLIKHYISENEQLLNVVKQELKEVIRDEPVKAKYLNLVNKLGFKTVEEFLSGR